MVPTLHALRLKFILIGNILSSPISQISITFWNLLLLFILRFFKQLCFTFCPEFIVIIYSRRYLWWAYFSILGNLIIFDYWILFLCIWNHIWRLREAFMAWVVCLFFFSSQPICRHFLQSSLGKNFNPDCNWGSQMFLKIN